MRIGADLSDQDILDVAHRVFVLRGEPDKTSTRSGKRVSDGSRL